MPRGDRPVFCSTVKRLLTNAYEVDLIKERWGVRPCQNEIVVKGLRSGEIGPNPDATPEELAAQAMPGGPPPRQLN